MRRRSFLISATSLSLAATVGHVAWAEEIRITGAGASFPNPLYQKWAEAAKAPTGLQLNYQSVGSGAGQAQIRKRTVDFGASDAPMKPEVLAEEKLLQFPSTMGSLVAIVNLPGIADNQLKMTGEILADIYLGKITKWNDKRIAEINTGTSLPDLAIAPIYRADGSGTTYVWVSYLSARSAEWKEKVGIGTSVKWPVGNGAKGNEGVAASVRNVRGAVGYVENAYAVQNKLVSTQLRNKAGHFVKPAAETFLAAASTADWKVPNFAANVIDTPGDKAWPIVSPTFIIVPKQPADPERALNVLRFFDWCYKNGDEAARKLEYIPLPESVKQAVRAAWKQVQDGKGHPVWVG